MIIYERLLHLSDKLCWTKMVSTQYIKFTTTPQIIMYVIKNMKNHINPLPPSDTIKNLREKKFYTTDKHGTYGGKGMKPVTTIFFLNIINVKLDGVNLLVADLPSGISFRIWDVI